MAQKRMFSKLIVQTDAFMEMPPTTQLLYFHLVMEADDEGFVANPKKVIKLTNSTEDDYKILVAKRFVLVFDSGVIVIKHWLIHNTIRMDRFNPTSYQDEKNLLIVKENKSYTLSATNWQPNGNQLVPQVNISQPKLSKNSCAPVAHVCASDTRPYHSGAGGENGKMTDEDFDKIWKIYRRHINKAKAKERFLKLDRFLMPKILNTIENCNNTIWKGCEDRFVPHLTTWINARRWEDEIAPLTIEQEYSEFQKTHPDCPFEQLVKKHPEWTPEEENLNYIKLMPYIG